MGRTSQWAPRGLNVLAGPVTENLRRGMHLRHHALPCSIHDCPQVDALFCLMTSYGDRLESGRGACANATKVDAVNSGLLAGVGGTTMLDDKGSEVSPHMGPAGANGGTKVWTDPNPTRSEGMAAGKYSNISFSPPSFPPIVSLDWHVLLALDAHLAISPHRPFAVCAHAPCTCAPYLLIIFHPGPDRIETDHPPPLPSFRGILLCSSFSTHGLLYN